MNQKDELEFDIEDILREFGSHQEPDPTPEPAAPVPEEEEEVTGDTIRLDKVREAVNAGQDADGTRPFTPVRIGEEEEEAPSPPVPESQEPVVEPFSEGWEPEYDDPIDDFSAPDPIPFRPQPRLRELREKLISGPERQYYALSEVGVGKLQAGIFLCLLVFLVSAGSTALHALGLVGTDRLRLLVFYGGPGRSVPAPLHREHSALVHLHCVLCGRSAVPERPADQHQRRFLPGDGPGPVGHL